jgi:hypothetical protein
MDIHHDTFLRSILEDNSISLTSRARIHYCLGKGVGLWLVVKPFTHLFCITHFTFTSALHFCLDMIPLSTFSFFMCKCEHELDASNMRLIRCLFGGQQIGTHDAI